KTPSFYETATDPALFFVICPLRTPGDRLADFIRPEGAVGAFAGYQLRPLQRAAAVGGCCTQLRLDASHDSQAQHRAGAGARHVLVLRKSAQGRQSFFSPEFAAFTAFVDLARGVFVEFSSGSLDR